MNTKPKTNPTESLLDRLEANYRHKSEFLIINLPGGETMKLRNVRTLTERKALSKASQEFAELVGNPAKCRPDWQEFLPIDPEIAESLGVLVHLSAEPKITHRDALRLHRMPEIADLISYQIQEAILNQNDLADVEDIEKKEEA